MHENRTGTSVEVGTINDAAERYDTDGAAIWEWICGGRTLTNPDGARVRLVANDRYPSPNGLNPEGPWRVEEVPA